MKTIYSLKEFHEEATKISGKAATHVSVRVEIGLFGKLEFYCYADGMGSFTAKTMEESLGKMSAHVNPRPIDQPNIDVEIEMPEIIAEEPITENKKEEEIDLPF